MKKIIVAGSRTFTDYTLLKSELDSRLKEDFILVSGCAQGADKLGEFYAQQRGLKIERHPAKWSDISVPNAVIKYNKYGAYNAMAGHNRNQEMLNSILENEDKGLVIAFWNGVSKGTKNMIEIAEKAGIYVLKIFI